jgi:hypothetical protein
MSYLNGERITVIEPSNTIDFPTAAKSPLSPPTVYDRVRLALRDYRGDQRALRRVISLVANKSVLPTDLLEQRVSEQIERELRGRITSVMDA